MEIITFTIRRDLIYCNTFYEVGDYYKLSRYLVSLA